MTRPCGQRCVICTRFTGSDGAYSIAPARFGGIATITWRAATLSASEWTVAPLSFHSILRTGCAEPDRAAELLGDACARPSACRRSRARPAPGRTARRCRRRRGSASRDAAWRSLPGSRSAPSRLRWRRACARSRSRRSGAAIRAKVTPSSRTASGCFHGACAVDRHREIVHRFLGLGVEIAAGKVRVGVVLDAVIFVGVEDAALQRHQAAAGRRIGLGPHFLDQRVEALLRRADPLPAEIHEGAVLHPHRPGAAADALARLQHHDIRARLLQPVGGREAREAGADDADIGADARAARLRPSRRRLRPRSCR